MNAQDSVIAQVFVDSKIVHVDGVFASGEILDLRISDYVNTCLEFRDASAILGSVERSRHDPEYDRVETACCKILTALAKEGSILVFHMELFSPAKEDGEWLLLEVGARVGGGMIPYIWRELHGIDLMNVAWDAATGSSQTKHNFISQKARTNGPNEIGGWLLIQSPIAPPCRVIGVKSMAESVDGPYAEFLPPIGKEIPVSHTFLEHIAARFRFRGASPSEVSSKLLKTSNEFSISVTPIS